MNGFYYARASNKKTSLRLVFFMQCKMSVTGKHIALAMHCDKNLRIFGVVLNFGT